MSAQPSASAELCCTWRMEVTALPCFTSANDPKACPFTVVVFAGDLKKMGDVRQLEGKQIEIKGTVQDYDGHAEIILRRRSTTGRCRVPSGARRADGL